MCFTGDLGDSVIRTGTPVSQMLAMRPRSRSGSTCLLSCVSITLAVPLGVLAAVRRHSWLDYGSMIGSSLGIALPNYWVALMLIIIFSLRLGWLPPFGSGPGSRMCCR